MTNPAKITKLTITGQLKPYGADGPAVACPTCRQTRGLTVATRDGEQEVTAFCPDGHRWLEEAITGDFVRETNAAIDKEAAAQQQEERR